MDDILNSSVTDPRGEKLLAELEAQELSNLSKEDLEERITRLRAEISRAEKALEGKKGASDAAEALFKS